MTSTKENPVSCRLVDICLPDYLQDHHNRPGELLIGVSLCGQGARQAAQDLIDDINGSCYQMPDEKAISETDLMTAAREATTGVDFRPFDEEGNRVAESDLPPEVWDHILEQCESYAYFLFEWDPTLEK